MTHLKPYTAPSPPHENISGKGSAQRSKTRLSPFHFIPKMKVLRTRSLSCPLMKMRLSSFYPLLNRNVQRTIRISLSLMGMNSSSMRLSPFYPIIKMSAHRRKPSWAVFNSSIPYYHHQCYHFSCYIIPSCHCQQQLHWRAVPPASPPHHLHPRILRVKVKELPKSCIGTKDKERAIVQLSTSARKESQTTKQ